MFALSGDYFFKLLYYENFWNYGETEKLIL